MPSDAHGVLVLADALEHAAPRAAHEEPDEQARRGATSGPGDDAQSTSGRSALIAYSNGPSADVVPSGSSDSVLERPLVAAAARGPPRRR